MCVDGGTREVELIMTVFDIAFLGTSLTAGTGTAFSGGAPRPGGMWQPELVRALQPGKSSEVRCYNFGIPGGASNAGLVQAPAVAAMRPRVAVIEFCINDAAGLSLAQSLSNTQSMVSLFQSANPDIRVVLMTMNNVLSAALPTRPNVPAYQDQYRALVAGRSDLLIIDNEPAWVGATTTQIPDSLHPLLVDLHTRLIPNIVSVIGPLIQ